MKLILKDQEVELPDEIESIARIEATINSYIEKQNLHFSHFVVDGIEIYENYVEFFKQNIGEINNVEAIVLSMEQFIEETVDTVQSYLTQAIPAIEQFVEELYDGTESIGSNKTLQLTEALDWIVQSVITIDSIEQKPTNWDAVVQYAVQLKPFLQEIVESFEQKDPVLFADLVQYEVMPILEGIEDNLKAMNE